VVRREVRGRSVRALMVWALVRDTDFTKTSSALIVGMNRFCTFAFIISCFLIVFCCGNSMHKIVCIFGGIK